MLEKVSREYLKEELSLIEKIKKLCSEIRDPRFQIEISDSDYIQIDNFSNDAIIIRTSQLSLRISKSSKLSVKLSKEIDIIYELSVSDGDNMLFLNTIGKSENAQKVASKLFNNVLNKTLEVCNIQKEKDDDIELISSLEKLML